MEFTYTEKNGSKPIEEWIVRNIKEYAKDKYGIELNVEIKDSLKKDGATSDKWGCPFLVNVMLEKNSKSYYN